MKAIVSLLGILAVAVLCAAHADAASSRKKRLRANLLPNKSSSTSRDKDNDVSGYYEQRLEAVRFGSKRWWTIYDAQVGGGQRP